MSTASVNDPCECGQTTIRGCADMPSRHCGAWEETTPPAFTAHGLSALAEQGMTLTEAEETTVRNARGQAAQPVIDIDALMAEMRAGFEKVNHGPHQLDITNEDRCSGLIDHIWRCSPANIRTLLDEIERLRADNARLRDAIAPLAEKFLWPDDSYDPDAVRADPDWDDEANEGTADDVWVTRGDIRRARAAMEASNGNQ